MAIGQCTSTRAEVAVWIQNSFDLDFLKSVYDGRGLSVFNTRALETKSSVYKPNIHNTSHSTHARRIEKYMERGFSVPNAVFGTNEVSGFMLRTMTINDDPWCAWLAMQDVHNALCFPGDSASWCIRDRMLNMQHVPLDSIHQLIRLGSHLSRGNNREKYLSWQQHLNARFGQWHRFNDVY